MEVKHTNGRRTRNLFSVDEKEPYRISRTKIELFLQCPRCFYLDRKLGIGRPDSPPFNLNLAVDVLLKREFDRYRDLAEPHPLMKQAGFNGVPFRHPYLLEWRDNRKGVRTLHEKTNFLVFGSVDDLWIDTKGKISVVDYKATSIDGIVSLDGEWRQAYKRQAEIYQWLLKRNGLSISDTAYFVYANGDKTRDSFDACLHFSMSVLPYKGSDSWVEEAIEEAHLCLCRSSPPPKTETCPWCSYIQHASAEKKDGSKDEEIDEE